MRHRFCGLLHFASAVESIGKMATRQNRVAHLFSPRSSCAQMSPSLLMLGARFARPRETQLCDTHLLKLVLVASGGSAERRAKS